MRPSSGVRDSLERCQHELEALLGTQPHSHDLIIKSAHVLAQLAGAYRGILEVVDLDKRLTALE
jgi:hypothetical protein